MFLPQSNEKGYTYQSVFTLEEFKKLIFQEVPEKYFKEAMIKYPFEEYFKLQVTNDA